MGALEKDNEIELSQISPMSLKGNFSPSRRPSAYELQSTVDYTDEISTPPAALINKQKDELRLTKGFSGFCRVVFPSHVRRFCIAAISGLCGGNTNVVVQNVMKVFNAEGYSIIFQWQFDLVVGALAILAIGQLYFLNVALAKYEAIFVVPTVNSVLIASACFAGLSLYNDAASLPPLSLALFSFGALIIIWGIVVLSVADTPTDIQPSTKKMGREDDVCSVSTNSHDNN